MPEHTGNQSIVWGTFDPTSNSVLYRKGNLTYQVDAPGVTRVTSGVDGVTSKEEVLIPAWNNLLENSTWWSGNSSATTSSSPASPQEISYNWPVLFLFTIVFLALGGNVLVCLAVHYERKLKNMFNYFLVSLALSDMLSATLVMPLSIIKVLINELPVPKLMCVAWYSLDVLFTSSTIIHLCMISVDRYMSLKYPLKYGHAKNSRHFVLKIVLVWVLSFCIAGPLFILSMYDKKSDIDLKGCGPESPIFIISATVTSFYLPLLIMTIMYILTVQALHSQRKALRRIAVTNSLSTGSAEGTTPRRTAAVPRSPRQANGHNFTFNASYKAGTSPLLGHKDTTASGSVKLNTTLTTAGPNKSSPESSPVSSKRSETFLLVNTQQVMDDLSPSSAGSVVDLAQSESSFYQTKDGCQTVRTFKFTKAGRKTSSLHRSTKVTVDKARRAVQVLGILFAVFVIFYLPFFALYVIHGTCAECRHYISPTLIGGFEWVAYSGSMVNPIVYHIFNPDFRRAFQKILRCRQIGRT